MKKILVALLGLTTVSAFAANPQLPELSKRELEQVSNEFAVNFSHTAVAAPETDGLWGVEVGLVGGKTRSTHLADVIDRTGEDGSKFRNTYHGGLMARAHFPLDLFIETTLLPERKIGDVTVSNKTLGLGWNAGGFFELPLDLALGLNFSNTDIEFNQTLNNPSTGNINVDSKINFSSTTRVLWVGASKTFLFFTPYIKVGTAKSNSDVKVKSSLGDIFAFSNSQKETVSSSGGYLVVGGNVQLFFLKLGLEASQTITVKKVSAKLSFDF